MEKALFRTAGMALFMSLMLAGAAPSASLNATDRQAIVAAVGPAWAGADDQMLLAAAESYAARELGQRVRPQQVDRRWSIQPPRRDIRAELATAREQGRIAKWLAGLSPPFAGYRALQAVRSRYAQHAEAGGWPSLEKGTALREGDRGIAVAHLRMRLTAEGFLRTPDGDLFDREVTRALASFQDAHALETDGVLGPVTLAALNVSAKDRLAQIDANLERWRWLPRDLPSERLEVDVAGAEATLFRMGQPALVMRVIVGDPRHSTPMFTSRIQGVIINPPWRVAASHHRWFRA